MEIDFDRLKYSLTGEYDEVMLEKENEELKDKMKKILEYIDRTRKLNILNGISSIQLAPIEDIIKGGDSNE